MEIKLPSETIFYKIENAIKTYRRFAQQRIKAEVDQITLDQSMTLIYLVKFPDLTQKELARLLFKDSASLTRSIESMVTKGFLTRSINEEDRRSYKLTITPTGRAAIDKLPAIIATNRAEALQGITLEELDQLAQLLDKITTNCE